VSHALSRRHFLLSSLAFAGLAKSAYAQQTNTPAALGPRVNLGGKLATRTAVVMEQEEAAMITAGSNV